METPTLTKMPTVDIALDDIFADETFNCRGHIDLASCQTLADEIKQNGLMHAITVRRATTDDPTDKPFCLVAGFRRYLAFKINKQDKIPAVIRDFNAREAALANLSENLHRNQLNIVQEAHGLKRLKDTGMLAAEIGIKLGKPTTWVNIRLGLLGLADDIQLEASAGRLNEHHINKILKISSKEAQYEYVRKVKTLLERGEALTNIKIVPDKIDPNRIRERDATEIMLLCAYLLKTELGEGPHSYVLSWAAGKISNARMFELLKEWCVSKNIKFEIPFLSEIPA